jgi:hypothetical protein
LPLILQKDWRTGRTANENPQLLHNFIYLALVTVFSEAHHSIRSCPKGCRFSLSGLSAESEKKNILCVLCAFAVNSVFKSISPTPAQNPPAV